jgi:hypothetical protein
MAYPFQKQISEAWNKSKDTIQESLVSYDLLQFYKHIGSRQKLTLSPLFSINLYDEELQKGFNLENTSQVKALIKQAFFTLTGRRELLDELDTLRGNYIVETIMDVIFDDGISGNRGAEIFNVKYVGDAGEKNNKEIQKKIDDFIADKKVKPIIRDIVKPTILYGEHILRLDVDFQNRQEGIRGIFDDSDLVNIVPVFRGQELIGFLKNDKGKPKKLSKHSHIYFCMEGDSKIRLYEEQKGSPYQEKMPEYIKIGRSIFYPAINQIKQLSIIEMSNLATDLKKILSPIMVMLGVPDNTNTKDAIELTNYYETKLNDIFRSLGQIQDLKFNDILAHAHRIKVLLNFGGNKGSIESLAIDQYKEGNRQKEEDLKRQIAIAVGIPPYYLVSEGQNQQRLESLKLYSRYSHKLNNIQQTFCLGIQQLVFLHLLYSGFNVSIENIQVDMQQLTNIEMMDDMEWLVATATSQSEYLRFLQEVGQATMGKIKINHTEYLEYIKRFTKQIPNAENILEENKNPPQPDQDEFGQGGGGFGGRGRF